MYNAKHLNVYIYMYKLQYNIATACFNIFGRDLFMVRAKALNVLLVCFFKLLNSLCAFLQMCIFWEYFSLKLYCTYLTVIV